MKRYIKSAILPLSEDYDTCSAIAHSDDTSNEFLSELSRSPYDTIRIAVAKNPNTPVSVLYQLAKDTSVAVRNAVLQNNNIPKELEMQLSPLNYRYSGRWSVTLFIAKPGGLTKADVAHYLSNTISELAETYGYTKYSDFTMVILGVIVIDLL